MLFVHCKQSEANLKTVYLFTGWKQSFPSLYFCRCRLVFVKLNLLLNQFVDRKEWQKMPAGNVGMSEGWLQLINSSRGRLLSEGMLKGVQTDYNDSQHCTNSTQPCSDITLTCSTTPIWHAVTKGAWHLCHPILNLSIKLIRGFQMLFQKNLLLHWQLKSTLFT